MPTYKFVCPACNLIWSETQPVTIEGPRVSQCKGCGAERQSAITGGTGVLMKGRMMNTYLHGYPDFTHNKHMEADKDAEIMERDHDAYVAEQKREQDGI